jgi:hypothetical protein
MMSGANIPSPTLGEGQCLISGNISLSIAIDLPGITSVNQDKLHFLLSDSVLSSTIRVGQSRHYLASI